MYTFVSFLGPTFLKTGVEHTPLVGCPLPLKSLYIYIYIYIYISIFVRVGVYEASTITGSEKVVAAAAAAAMDAAAFPSMACAPAPYAATNKERSPTGEFCCGWVASATPPRVGGSLRAP
jgi:hypothetical protein